MLASRIGLLSLGKPKQNARIWQELDGWGDIVIVRTTRDAIGFVRENYGGAEVLITGSAYLSGNALRVLG